MFQFLIGRLITAWDGSNLWNADSFQFLIGRLITLSSILLKN